MNRLADVRDGLRVALFAEQLTEPDPGAIGLYTRALLRRLPATGVELEPVVAWHRAGVLSDAGVPHARRLRRTQSSLYKRWSSGRPPGLGGDAAVVHAPSLAFPPRDDRPLLVTVHDTLFLEDPETFPPAALAFARAMVERLSDADTVIVPSRTTGNTLATLGRPPKRIRVVPHGTDMTQPSLADRDAALERLGVERPYVLWTGTLEARRNPEGVVRGFIHALSLDIPDADNLSLYLAGPPGWWSRDLAAFVDSKGLTGRVRRIDQQPGPVRAALYAGASAFVFPSLAEGFGLPIVEAMACGAPVVTSNRSSLPEIAGSAAELCDPADVESIGESLAKVLRDRGLAEDLRRLGFRRASEFTWERTARETYACYREALAARDIPAY
jgi:glycosyltransferase involved in cell wall biosynthesis